MSEDKAAADIANNKEKKIKHDHVALGRFESTFNWCFWFPVCMSTFVLAYRLSTKLQPQLARHYFVTGWFEWQRDATDQEWESWREQVS